ncbi:MAG: hypothetical protein WA228_06615 [Desulfobaccales bacterium]
MEPTLIEAEAAYSSIYEHHAPLIRFLTGSGTPRPQVLAVAADLCLNAKIRKVVRKEGLDPEVVRPLLEEARLAGATLDATALGLLLAVNIESLAEQLHEEPEDLSRLERLNKAAQLVRTLPFEVNLWKTQNICYKILQAHYPNFEKKARLGDQNAQEWLRHYTVLAENFFAAGAHIPQQTCKWIDDREVSHEYAKRDLSDSIQSCIWLSGRPANYFLSGGPGHIRLVRFSHIQSRQGQPPRL